MHKINILTSPFLWNANLALTFTELNILDVKLNSDLLAAY